MLNAEDKLWGAVLIHAARDLLTVTTASRQIFRAARRRSAREWFESEEYEVGDFLWCADVVGIDGPSFRRRLLRRADRKNGHTSGKGRVEIVDPGASVREIFGDFPPQNEKAAGGPPSL